MSKVISILIFIVVVVSSQKVGKKNAETFQDIKEKINDCLLQNSTSEKLIRYARKPGTIKGNELPTEDKKLLRNCAKEVLAKKQKNKDNKFDNIINQPRRLSMLSNFSSFNILGIFTCIEYAQPAIKLIRGAINMLKSMDYTSAVISVYDNFSTIGDAFSFCYNAIFPGN